MEEPLIFEVSRSLYSSSINGEEKVQRPSWRQLLKAVKSEVFASLLSSINTILGAIALSATLFAPQEVKHVTGIGLRQCLVGIVAVELMVAAFSKYSIMICPAGGEAIANLTHIVQLCIAALADDPAALKANILWAFVFTSLISGTLLFSLGQLKCGRLANYVAMPVRVGAFAGIGYVMLSLAFGIAADAWIELTDPSTWLELFTLKSFMHWMPGITLGWLLDRTFARYWDARWSPFIFPGFFIGGTIIFNLVRVFLGISLHTAEKYGWTQSPLAVEPPWVLYQSMSPGLIDSELMIACLPDMAVAAVIGPLVNSVVNIMLLEDMLGEKCHLDHELTVHGAGLLAGAAVGGFHAFVSVSDTNNHKSVGGRTKVSLVMYVGFILFFLLVPASALLVQYIPKPLIGALFVSFGIDLLRDAFQKASQYEDRVTKSIILFTFLICIFNSMAKGLQYGIMMAFVKQVYEASVLSPVEVGYTVSEHRSTVIRSAAEDRFLTTFGSRARIVRVVCDNLFFANIGPVTSAMIDASKAPPGALQVRLVLLDLTSVRQFDSSALEKLAGVCCRLSSGRLVLLSGLSAEANVQLHKLDVEVEASADYQKEYGVLCAPTFMDAIEAAEDILLRISSVMTARRRKVNNYWTRYLIKLTCMINACHAIGALRADYAPLIRFATSGFCAIIRLQAGETLFDPDRGSSGIYFLAGGTLNLDVGELTLKLRVPGTFIGVAGVFGLPDPRGTARAATDHNSETVVMHISAKSLVKMATLDKSGVSNAAITRLCLCGLQQLSDLVSYRGRKSHQNDVAKREDTKLKRLSTQLIEQIGVCRNRSTSEDTTSQSGHRAYGSPRCVSPPATPLSLRPYDTRRLAVAG